MKQSITIQNKSGLHARPASLFVQAANRFKSKIEITAKGKTIDAKSILMIMSMGLTKGTEIELTAKGEDEGEALQALISLIETNFGESDN